jgi:hypothetical protein
MTVAKALEKWEFDATTPAYQMCLFPHNLHELPVGNGTLDAAMLKAAMDNMWLYGRVHGWKWLAGENPYAIKVETDFSILRGFQSGLPGTSFTGRMTETHRIKGWGILAGSSQCDWSNCEGYAVALKVFAERILGITGIEKASITGHYLTAPVTAGTIDRGYGPTVKTATKAAADTGVYYYATHAFLRLGGKYYDVTGNAIFDQAQLDVGAGQTSQAKFCDLVPVKDPPTKEGKDGKLRLFEVANADATLAAQLGLVPGRKAWLMELAENPVSWSDWILVEADNAKDVSKID